MSAMLLRQGGDGAYLDAYELKRSTGNSGIILYADAFASRHFHR